MARLSVENALKLLIYITLGSITSMLIWNGPLSAVIKNSSNLVETFIDLKDLPERVKWPSLTICRTPVDKDEAKYYEFFNKGISGTFKDEAEFESMAKETFYSNPEELIHALTISREYFSALYANKSDIPLAPPFVQTSLIDYVYNGFCAIVSLESLRDYMVSKKLIKEEELDSPFSTIIWLKGSADVHGAFLIKFSSENDTVTYGVNNLLNTNAVLVEYSSVKVFMVSYGIRQRITNCEEKKAISPCIIDFYDKVYGNDVNNLVRKSNDISTAKFSGLEIMQNMTGCKAPCENNEYFMTPFAQLHMENSRDPGKLYLKSINATNSTILILNHMAAEKIKMIQEIPVYTAMTFIGDVGGIAGLFLGLSFWSIYGDLICPTLQRVKKLFFKKK